jgi:isoleucyl-tRNA synthetase
MDFKDSVFLPKTSFAMKAGLATKELDILKFWQHRGVYEKLRAQANGRKKFTLHFGPPYANGNIHMGHALSEVLKDIVNKTHQMLGYDAPMVPGWDCHGLPIEWKIEENYRKKGIKKEDVSVSDFIQECRTFAKKWIDIQRDEFKRLGIIADFDNPYITMDPKTEASIAEQLLAIFMKGLLYKGMRPVSWSVVEQTALAEAEVEYQDHTSDAIDVAFPIINTEIAHLAGVEAVIWTTTPWTLPGNRAIAYGPDFTYVVIETETGRRFLIVKELVSAFCKRAQIENYSVLNAFPGHELQGLVCAHPLRGKGYDFDVPLLASDHVTTETGTGLVHTAPGHGVEDFLVGKKHGLDIPATVGGDGVYYSHVPLFAGQHVYKVNPLVLDELRAKNRLLSHHKLVHSYPHSWRSKTPLIYRTTSQWFLSIDAIRDQTLKAIDNTHWFPKQGRNRIYSMVEKRPDWCLSRQRTWGVPITLFLHKQTGEPLRDERVNDRIVAALAEHGIEAWQKFDEAYFLKGLHDPIFYEKTTDILDVWFDSACTNIFVLKDRPNQAWPADVYFEGSDQHRGWFQSSLMVSTALCGQAPYKNVVTHGFVLDEKGYKMSKSSGNGLSPQEIMKTQGADILRLWIVNSDYSEDVRIGSDILKHQEDIYRRFRNTLRYLLGALHGYSPEESVPFDALPSLEKWVLHQLHTLQTLHLKCVQEFDFSTFYTALHTFCSVDLSAFYFDIRKDTLYCDRVTSTKRKATRMVMNQVFLSLIHWLAPVLSFTGEEAWFAYHNANFDHTVESIHEQLFPVIPENWYQEELAKDWKVFRDVRRVITSALEIERAAKTIGSSLQAHVAIYATNSIAQLLQQIDLAELSITSGATLLTAQPPAHAVTLDDMPDVGVVVTVSEHEKCGRCWRHMPEVGISENATYAKLCTRCEAVVQEGA